MLCSEIMSDYEKTYFPVGVINQNLESTLDSKELSFAFTQ